MPVIDQLLWNRILIRCINSFNLSYSLTLNQRRKPLSLMCRHSYANMYFKSQKLLPWFPPILKQVHQGASRYIQGMLCMTLNAPWCLECLMMHKDAPWWAWLHLYVLGCSFSNCFNLGGNYGSRCTWMVFDANLLVCHEKNYPFLTA